MLQNYADMENSKKERGNFAGSSEIFYLQDVGVTFGNVRALSNIQLKINKGEILFITGPSGAGKTTLLRILAGMQEPTEGRVDFPSDLGKRDLFSASVFQDLRLIDNESCEENLFYAYDRRIYRSKHQFYQDLVEFARLLGIYDRLHIRIADANGGLKQKICFICSLLTKPGIVLADEPTASLDYENAKKMYDILNVYNSRKNLTVVWASHNKDLIKKFTGRIIHLDKGKIIYSGNACFI